MKPSVDPAPCGGKCERAPRPNVLALLGHRVERLLLLVGAFLCVSGHQMDALLGMVLATASVLLPTVVTGLQVLRRPQAQRRCCRNSTCSYDD
jgi:hypothetical protein